MRKGFCLLSLFLFGNVCGMRNLEVRFVEYTAPMMLEQFRNLETTISQALINSEQVSGRRYMVETVLRFFVKNKTNIENDTYLYTSICEYIMHAGTAFADNEVKQKKLCSLVIGMISTMAKRREISAFEKFYKLFSDSKIFGSMPNSKFAAYSMLAYSIVAESLSMYDVNIIDELSRLSRGSDRALNDVLQNIVKSAPFSVGVYYDVRPEHDALTLGDTQRKEIEKFLKARLNEEISENATQLQIAFKTAVLTMFGA